jgi:hypothetical protein
MRAEAEFPRHSPCLNSLNIEARLIAAGALTPPSRVQDENDKARVPQFAVSGFVVFST